MKDENISVMGEDVYNGDEDVFDLEITEDGADYSVLEDANIYTDEYDSY